LYRDRLVPRAELAVTTAMTGWTTGRTMFLEVMDARRMLSEARVMLARAVHEQHQMVTELVTCCGVADLDSLTMLGVEVKPASP
jgi:outer membrane protein TolC